MATNDDEALIARLQDTFAKNLKAHSDVARLRGDLAVTVNSHIIHDEHDDTQPVQVDLRELQFTGCRRRFLEALKSSVEAQQRFHDLSSRDWDTRHSPAKAAADGVSFHLDLARLRRHHQELVIRRRYAHKLSEDASTSCTFDLCPSDPTDQVNGVDIKTVQNQIVQSVDTVKYLTTELQRAILQATHLLKQQKSLLADVHQTQVRSGASSDESSARARAIEATRNVLVTWLNEKLSGGDPDQDGAKNYIPVDSEAQQKSSAIWIADRYEGYLEARKAFFKAANEAQRPLSTPMYAVSAEKEAYHATKELASPSNSSVVHTISQRLMPLLQQQADYATLRSYASTQTAKERQNTLEGLERLADESHLLSASASEREDRGEELMSSVAAWTHAANVASNSLSEESAQHTAKGLEALAHGNQALEDLRAYSGGDDGRAPSSNNGIAWRAIRGNLR